MPYKPSSRAKNQGGSRHSPKTTLQPYRELMQSLLRDRLTPDTFSTAYLALYDQDDEAIKTLPKAPRRILQTVYSACEALQAPAHQRDRYEYGPDDLRQEVEHLLSKLQS